MAHTSNQSVAQLFYGWGAAKYRGYFDRFKMAANQREQSDVMSEMRNLGEALSLAASSLGDPLSSPELAEVMQEAKDAAMSKEAQEALRADLSLFLVRHVQDVVHETEDSFGRWQRASCERPTPEEVRTIFRWHAKQVLDLLQLLPNCDVVLVVDEIERVIDLIQRNTVRQLRMLVRDQRSDIRVEFAA
ncbi:MAG: hypothetical protein ACR2PG_07955 [Hyphomicrobiaceae bacterium]